MTFDEINFVNQVVFFLTCFYLKLGKKWLDVWWLYIYDDYIYDDNKDIYDDI